VSSLFPPLSKHTLSLPSSENMRLGWWITAADIKFAGEDGRSGVATLLSTAGADRLTTVILEPLADCCDANTFACDLSLICFA